MVAADLFLMDRYINGQDSEEKRARRQASGGDEARPLLLCVWRRMAARQACRPVWLAAGALLPFASMRSTGHRDSVHGLPECVKTNSTSRLFRQRSGAPRSHCVRSPRL